MLHWQLKFSKRTAILIVLFLSMGLTALFGADNPVYSKAGFFPLDNTGREVVSMNADWLFLKGSADDAWRADFDDSSWQAAVLPHGIEYLPAEASGCMNYQGEVWYRKHFVPDASLDGRRIFIHFEAIMGKSKVWVNGQQVAEHFGGYMPVIADVTDLLLQGKENVIAVWADNSDDPLFPPGKPQADLDFTYFGGIYRDCWLVSHSQVYITDPNFEDEAAGGGLFISYGKVGADMAEVNLKTHVRNASGKSFGGKVLYELLDRDGRLVKASSVSMRLAKGADNYASSSIKVSNPRLWSPEDPYLYRLNVRILDSRGKVVDGYMRRVGIRSVEFRGEEGFFLNGKPYEGKLMGANRHQDFAVIGNALPNSMHWRDAVKLRKAGLKVIRNTHYPQDPAFMDACDSLGLFVIVNTPGWQFWSDEPIFAQRVFEDIRNMVRRDRNHTCVLMWEPVLNETGYTADFGRRTHDIVKEEYPYPYCYTVADRGSPGYEKFDVMYSHPTSRMVPGKCHFTREWGDNVDDWDSHNSTSRASLSWGEIPQLIQAEHYASPPYSYICYDRLCKTPTQHVGGCLWHSFDHQRGYHPDPFYGGIMDEFRQPKYSYSMFTAQRPVGGENSIGTGPMVFIANQMTPFSPNDVTVYSNCDEVHLTVFRDGRKIEKRKEAVEGMPSPVMVFEDAFDFMECKAMSRRVGQDGIYLLAEGFVDGKLVATHKVTPALRPEKLVLWLDNEGIDLVADGSDMVVVVAGVADRNGNIKRLNNSYIKFTVEGEGEIVGDESVMANPRQVVWGTAPILVRSTGTPGKIVVKASILHPGAELPSEAELVFESR